jgi:hypothetical protein
MMSVRKSYSGFILILFIAGGATHHYSYNNDLELSSTL